MIHDSVTSPHVHSTRPAAAGCSRDSGPMDSHVYVHPVPQVNFCVDNQCVDDVTVRGGKGVANKTSGFKRKFDSLSDDPCDFDDDNEVMVSLLETFGSINAESQSAGLQSCIPSSSPAHSHFSGPCLPLGAPSGRGGRGCVRPHGRAHALCAFPSQQRTEGSLLPHTNAGCLETDNRDQVSPERHCQRSCGYFQGWHPSSLHRYPPYPTRDIRGRFRPSIHLHSMKVCDIP